MRPHFLPGLTYADRWKRCAPLGSGTHLDVSYSAASGSCVGCTSSSLEFSSSTRQTQRAHFLDENVEALRNTGLEGVVATDDRFVDLGTAGHVVRLHRQHFLQGVGGAVGFQSPDFHFPEALTAELRLAAQRLLGNERVRTDRTGVDLVVDKVVQLQHVDVADGHLAVELIAGTAVIQRRLTGNLQACLFQHLVDVGFDRTVEDRRCDRHAATGLLGQTDDPSHRRTP